MRNCSATIRWHFLVDHPVAQKAGRHAKALCRDRIGGNGHQIAGKLLDHELVVREIAVVGVDHPIAPGVLIAGKILFVAIAVGITGGVEPVPRPLFAEVRRGEQSIDLLFVGVGVLVAQEFVQFLRGRGQADQIERQLAAAAFARSASGDGFRFSSSSRAAMN